MESTDRIEAVFDRRSKTLERDVQKFREQLKALELKVAPASLLVGARRDGHLLTVTVLPCVKAAAPEASDQLTEWREF